MCLSGPALTVFEVDVHNHKFANRFLRPGAEDGGVEATICSDGRWCSVKEVTTIRRECVQEDKDQVEESLGIKPLGITILQDSLNTCSSSRGIFLVLSPEDCDGMGMSETRAII